MIGGSVGGGEADGSRPYPAVVQYSVFMFPALTWNQQNNQSRGQIGPPIVTEGPSL